MLELAIAPIAGSATGPTLGKAPGISGDLETTARRLVRGLHSTLNRRALPDDKNCTFVHLLVRSRVMDMPGQRYSNSVSAKPSFVNTSCSNLTVVRSSPIRSSGSGAFPWSARSRSSGRTDLVDGSVVRPGSHRALMRQLCHRTRWSVMGP